MEYGQIIEHESEPLVAMNADKMGVVYFKDNGEIYTIVWGNDTLETIYGPRAETFGQIVNVLSIAPSDYIFNRPQDFYVNLEDASRPEILIKEDCLQMYNIFIRSQPKTLEAIK